MNFSLAICTYNRSHLLSDALSSLADARQPQVPWELLLIDNNSSDETRGVVESFNERLPVRYVFESKQGLSHARNRAIRECKSDILLFTDDDVRFDSEWLNTYAQAFVSEPQAGWFGGRVSPLWPQGKPHWLRDESMALISGLLVHYDLGTHNRFYLADDPTPFGASFALRREVFERVGNFRVDLGVCGTVPGRGEEAEYFERIRPLGMPGFYVGAASAWHWQDPRRLHWTYLYHYGVQKGIAGARIQGGPRSLSGSWYRELNYGLKAVWQLLKLRGDRARQCVINMGIEAGMRAASNSDPVKISTEKATR